MAKRSVKDRVRTVKKSSVSSPPKPPPNSVSGIDVLDIIDRIEDGFGKVKSMLEIVQYDGIRNCTLLTQLRYLSILEDLLNTTRLSFRKLRDHCLERGC